MAVRNKPLKRSFLLFSRLARMSASTSMIGTWMIKKRKVFARVCQNTVSATMRV